MLDVDEACLVDRHAVRLAPADRVGHLAPIVVAFVAMFTPADDRVLADRLVGGMHERPGRRGRRGRGQGRRAGLLEEVASTHGAGPDKVASSEWLVPCDELSISSYQSSAPGTNRKKERFLIHYAPTTSCEPLATHFFFAKSPAVMTESCLGSMCLRSASLTASGVRALS